VYAEGLSYLAKSLEKIANISVVAPDRNRSGASNSLTLTRPLRYRQLENTFYSVEGTPTDCVHLAITGFLSESHDMVVSGINPGANLGDDVFYSGTVAAAMEGRFLGLPAIALSLVAQDPKHYQTAANIAKILVLQLLHDPLPAQTILNVNIPDLPHAEIKGFEVTRLGARHKAEGTIRDLDPRGNEIFWFGPPGLESDSGPGTDFHAVSRGFVSITPLILDFTNYKAFDQLSGWTQGLKL
jgi:5'-nucleotidase